MECGGAILVSSSRMGLASERRGHAVGVAGILTSTRRRRLEQDAESDNQDNRCDGTPKVHSLGPH